MSTVNDFDRIASFYDRLAKWVFGNSILKSQTIFFHLLTKESDVLILGGGSGQLLESMPLVRSIDYVEKSRKMIELARKKHTKSSVTFLNSDFFDWEVEKKYDFIVCPFFLDCFNEINLRKVVEKIKIYLNPIGMIWVADFDSKSTSRTLSSLMHFFFRIASNLEAKKLKDINHEILLQGFEVKDEKFFHQNTIFSRVYRNL